MKSLLARLAPLVLGLAISFAAAPGARAKPLLIEAEELENLGGWHVARDARVARELLWSDLKGHVAPAAGAIALPHAGRWRLWVRSKDYPKDRPGTRNFSVRLGATRAAVLFGRHGREGLDGWDWEDGGSFELPAGALLLVIGEDNTGSARCDALVLSDDPDYRPKGTPWTLKLAAAPSVPLSIRTTAPQDAIVPEPLQAVDAAPLATLENAAVRFTFHRTTTSSGPAIALRAAVHADSSWKPLPGDPGAESYRVLFRPSAQPPHLTSTQVHPAWDNAFGPPVELSAGGASVRSRLGPPTAPWASARCFPLRPVAARQIDPGTVELDFVPIPAGQLKAVWHLAAGESQARVSLDFKPAAPGWVSLGYHGLMAAPAEQFDFLLLPFLYHGKRFPAQPVLLQSAQMPTPLALVERNGLSYALAAEPADLPFAWPSATNSRFALGLRNEAGLAQPLLYSPVLGQPGSESAHGEPVRARFRVWAQAGDWFAAYRGAAQQVFGLTDYRRPVQGSLSDAALNLYDLMRDEAASGWDARAKGPWNIESRNVVSHSSPLTYLSYYLLTGDEDFYRRFARPALEFMLSRPGAHFAAERAIGSNYYHHQPMKGPMSTYGAAVVTSAFELTQGRTPALAAAAVDAAGQPRTTRGYSHVQPFEDALALYRMTGDTRWRDAAIAGGDRYIAENLTRLPTRDLGPTPFVNLSFVPDWEGLLHLHEATGEPRFLAASVAAARWLVTTLWTQPVVPAGDTTIHPGGRYSSAEHVWWFGDLRYRRGFIEGAQRTSDEQAKFTLPPATLPEKRVPAWQVSNVGLGLEQPSTYTRAGNDANITMNTWAPNFLRLAQLTGDDVFRVAARNSTIGRFTNYPGYYLDGLTDQYQRPDYPVAGPDVTWLYVHHIPPFAAYVLDYLFTDAETRSRGAVQFPWVRQCGYVWFDSRLRGHAPGKVYGQAAWPWLHRTAATVDNVAVDRVLAHGDGKFHVILLNQSREPQRVRVTFDPKVLGRSLASATAALRLDNAPPTTVRIQDSTTTVELPPLGLAALTVDGVSIDVPTHRTAPPARYPLPTTPASRRQALPGTSLEAVGTELQVPPFTWRDLFVYVTAGIDDLSAATLFYRVGDGPEQRVDARRFPWEFTVRIDDMTAPVTWRVEATSAPRPPVRTE
ncbi:MAG: hypothetical protein NTV51_16250 [Verrucomicrobia bacterium]|nr:hypothetical protein [Verrucomicrobiota bacterium]